MKSLIHKTRKLVKDGLNGRVRIALAWVFAFGIILSANRYPNILGIMICFCGATLRFWASGYLRKDAALTVSGPYRFTRNPLYLGTYLIAMGAVISIEAWALGALITFFFFFVYDVVVDFEESRLTEYFGEPYKRFCARVPRFLGFRAPLSPEEMNSFNPVPASQRFSGEAIRKNKALEAYWSFLGLTVALTLIAYIRIEYLKI